MDTGLLTCEDADCQPCVGDGYEGKEMTVAAEYLHWRFRKGTLARESFDLGAHVGLWSAFLVGEYGRYGGGHIYALEPDPKNFEALAENARRLLVKTGMVGVEPVQAAAWSANRELLIKRDKHPARHSVVEPVLRGPNGGSGTSDNFCRGIAIDSVLVRDDQPKSLDFVKVDIEGTELFAMNGMRQTIEDNPLLLVLIEYSFEHFVRYGYNTEKMTAFMNTCGMRFARPEDERLAASVASGGLVKIFFTKGDSPWRSK
jgi:FkbM family methyltransferase